MLINRDISKNILMSTPGGHYRFAMTATDQNSIPLADWYLAQDFHTPRP